MQLEQNIANNQKNRKKIYIDLINEYWVIPIN